jgi:hypothetical protein
MPEINAVLDRIEEMQRQRDAIEVAADATPLDFLCAVFRDPGQPMQRRMKAASEAAQYVHPKLAVVANVEGKDFATRLERAVERSRQARVINAQPMTVEGPSNGPTQRTQMMIPDRRFRRF